MTASLSTVIDVYTDSPLTPFSRNMSFYAKNIQLKWSRCQKPVDSFLHFKGAHMQHPIQYPIYADFESLILPISTLSSHHSYNMKVSQHVPWGYANLIIELDRKPLKIIQCYRGKNAVKHFLDALITEKELLITFLSSSLSSQCDYPRMKKEFMKQLQCHIC